MTLFPDLTGAEFSEDGRYRYRLWRYWDPKLPPVNFIMLNPSTADAEVDDPTIRSCLSLARGWSEYGVIPGIGGVVVTNLFAYRATQPEELAKVLDPVGPENDDALRLLALETHTKGGRVIAAWGTRFSDYQQRAERVTRMLEAHGVELCCLGTCKDGAPRHPLYLRNTTNPVPYRGKER